MIAVLAWVVIVAIAAIFEMHWLGVATALYGLMIQLYTWSKINNDPLWYLRQRHLAGIEQPGEHYDLPDSDLAALRRSQMRSTSRAKLAMATVCLIALAYFAYRWIV